MQDSIAQFGELVLSVYCNLGCHRRVRTKPSGRRVLLFLSVCSKERLVSDARLLSLYIASDQFAPACDGETVTCTVRGDTICSCSWGAEINKGGDCSDTSTLHRYQDGTGIASPLKNSRRVHVLRRGAPKSPFLCSLSSPRLAIPREQVSYCLPYSLLCTFGRFRAQDFSKHQHQHQMRLRSMNRALTARFCYLWVPGQASIPSISYSHLGLAWTGCW